MTASPPFRFGVQLGIDSDWPLLTTPRAWRDLARQVEDLGYSSLLLADHFRNTFAPIPALVAAAEATSTLRVGTLAINNDLRHPVILANEMATLDILSGGRSELGIGAGWDDADYRVAGIPKASPGARIARLEEALQVIKGYFSGEPMTFHGDQYSVTDLVGLPRPTQRPHPPILVGGGGRRVLTLAAQQADIVGINPPIKGAIGRETGVRATAAATDEKVSWIREAAGRRIDDIELNIMVFYAAVTSHQGDTARDAWFTGEMDLSVDDALASPHMLVGTTDQMTDLLLERRERWGVGYWIFQGVEAMTSLAPVVQRLAGS
jgi:probable F420-dependent oxidoreductase